MARVRPEPPTENVPDVLAEVIERRRAWPNSVEMFAAICDAVDNHGMSVAWAAKQLGLKRAQVYRDYWSPYRARYEAGEPLEDMLPAGSSMLARSAKKRRG